MRDVIFKIMQKNLVQAKFQMETPQNRLFYIQVSQKMHLQKRRSQKISSMPDLIKHLRRYGQLTLRDMSSLVLEISALLKTQPNLLNLTSPVLVVGDIHGQFYDLVNLLDRYGSPQSKQMIFLGDYVDRGSFSIEVITLLFSYKLKYPNNIHLLRGNHECRALTSIFNFKQECISKYNQTIYQEIMNIFDSLPICALIDRKYFAVHGGISPNCKMIKDIQGINRFKEIPVKGELCDFLWSDPVNLSMDAWKPNNVRQCSYYFGFEQAKHFLDRNSLKLIIRGHQVEREGFKYQKLNNVPLTLTVFSAPNYGDVYNNKGCVAELTAQSIELHTFKQVDHPVILPNFQSAIEWTLPFVSSCVHHAFRHLLMLNNSKLSSKLQEIMSSKKKFQEDLQASETVKLIDTILAMDQKQLASMRPCVEEEAERKQESFTRRESFNKRKRSDSKQKMPKVEPARVIGPKIILSNNKLKELELSDQEEEQSMNERSEMNFSLKVLIPIPSIQKIL